MSAVNGFEIVRDVIYEACRAALPSLLPGVRVSRTPPASVNVPAAIVQPAAQTIRYGDKTISELASWRFELLLLLGNINEHAAQVKAGELVAPSSDLIQALNYARIDNGWLDLIEANVGNQTYNARTYGGAKINISGVC